MDFHQLRVFVEVVRQKSFSRAAESIFLSQPTVSAHVKALENEIGVPLLDRSQRQPQLTEAGKILFRYAQQFLGLKEEALAAIQKEYEIVKGHLEIAASSVPGTYLLPGILFLFHQRFPEVTFSVMLRDTKQVLESIKEFTFDLGFVGEPGNHEDLEQVKLVDDELILITPPGTKLPFHEPEGTELPSIDISSCLELPFILREPGSATRTVFEKAYKKHTGKKAALNIVAFLEGQEGIKEAVKKGLGVTVISRRAVAEELRGQAVEGYKIMDLTLERSFYLIYSKKRILAPLGQAFVDLTSTYFRTELPLLDK